MLFLPEIITRSGLYGTEAYRCHLAITVRSWKIYSLLLLTLTSDLVCWRRFQISEKCRAWRKDRNPFSNFSLGSVTWDLEDGEYEIFLYASPGSVHYRMSCLGWLVQIAAQWHPLQDLPTTHWSAAQENKLKIFQKIIFNILKTSSRRRKGLIIIKTVCGERWPEIH